MTKRHVGRPLKKERASHCCMVRFTDTEFARFLTRYEQSGVPNRAVFIKVDRSLLDYYQKLTTLYGQFRSVGVNYNQTVVALKSNFTEKKAFTMLAKLEKMTLELAVIGGEIVQLTREFQEKWSQK